jgi:hypothetical protein
MSTDDTTGATGANRGQPGAEPQPGTTGVTGATGVHKTQWPGAPVPGPGSVDRGHEPHHPKRRPPAIPATPGTFALFEGGEWVEPVLAWDDEGHPLILDNDDRLTRARDRDGFDSINADAPAPPPTIAATPGWWAIIHGHRCPVVAWQIDHHGNGMAIAAIGSRLGPIDHLAGDLFFLDPDLGPVAP